jgi:branched-chain amino acid transport system permease protein
VSALASYWQRPGARLVAAAVLACLAILVFVGSLGEFEAHRYTLWTSYGLLALSLTYVWGRAGIFSLGQALLFGVGGYTYGIVAINLLPVTGETISAVLIATLAGGLVAGLLGAFVFYGRLSEVYVAVVTLATALVVQTFMNSTGDPSYHVGDAVIGGFNGMVGIPSLTIGSPGSAEPVSSVDLLIAVGFLSVAIVLFLRWLDRRPFGRVVVAVRENESRTELLGYDSRRYRLLAFVLGGMIAAIGGACYAMWGLVVNPEVFGLRLAALVAVWSLLGGRTALIGAFVGAFLVEGLSTELGGSAADLTPFVIGGLLIAAVMFLPRGIVPELVGLPRRIAALRNRGAVGEESDGAVATLAGIDFETMVPHEDPGKLEPLEVTDLRKQFGNLVAVDGVSLSFGGRGVWCLIGPNGAGKSTFFDLLVGRQRPSGGRVLLGDTEIQRLPPHRRARAGFGIKLQVASLYTELPVSENVWLAAYAHSKDAAEAERRSEAILASLGLSEAAAEPAGSLSHGAQQWLEIGMVMASEPKIVLLDEPAAGMSRAEADKTVALVRELGRHACVIVVEHDMQFVRQLEAPVTVFHQGAVFAQGTIEDLRENDEVLDIYLGRPVSAET